MDANKETTGTPDIAAFAAAFLKKETGADGVEIHSCKRLGGGAIQENLALDLTITGGPWAGRHELVLRTDSPSSLAVSLGRAEEFAVLKVAFAAGVKVPEPLWLHRDAGELGKDFYLMRKAGGSAAARPLVRGDLTTDERDALLFELGGELAKLHTVRPPVASLDFLPLPDRRHRPPPADPRMGLALAGTQRPGQHRNNADPRRFSYRQLHGRGQASVGRARLGVRRLERPDGRPGLAVRPLLALWRLGT